MRLLVEEGESLSYFTIIESVVEIDAKNEAEAQRKAEGLKSSLNLLFGSKAIEINTTEVREYFIDEEGAYE